MDKKTKFNCGNDGIVASITIQINNNNVDKSVVITNIEYFAIKSKNFT